jgi:hypothetical protein
MSPLHNIEPESTLVKMRMEKIKEQMDDIGGVGLGHYALARGYIA